MPSINTRDDIIIPFIAWIKGEHPNTPVIVDRSNTPRPNEDYISVRVSSPVQQTGSRDDIEHKDDTKFNIGGARTFTMTIEAYKVKSPSDSRVNYDFFDPQDRLIKLNDALEDPNRRLPLTKAGLAVWNKSAIIDVTELIETGYESRAQVDYIMGMASNREADLGIIEKVAITPTIEGEEDPEFTVDAT